MCAFSIPSGMLNAHNTTTLCQMDERDRLDPADQFEFDQGLASIDAAIAELRAETAELRAGELEPTMPAYLAREVAELHRTLLTTLTETWWKAQPFDTANASFTEIGAKMAQRAAYTSEHGMQPFEQAMLKSIEQASAAIENLEAAEAAGKEREANDPHARCFATTMKLVSDGMDRDEAFEIAVAAEPELAHIYAEIQEYKQQRAAGGGNAHSDESSQ